jgi:hypothetical protein
MVSCLDDFIDENNQVRVIDAFVNVLDVESIGFRTYEANTSGQRPYDRKDKATYLWIHEWNSFF